MRKAMMTLVALGLSTAALADTTVGGAVGYRFDSAEAGSAAKVTRDRIKAEVTVSSKVNDQINVVVGARTGTFNSAYNDLGNGTNLQSVGFSQAYLEYAAAPNVKVTFGKMNQPWASSSSLFFDRDIKPEGVALSYSNKAGVFANASKLTITEGGAAADTGVTSVQVGAKKDIAGLAVTGAVGLQDYANVGAQAYKVQQVFVSAGKTVAGRPVNVFVDSLKNSEAKTAGNALSYGVKIGNASAPKSYDVALVRQKVEANSQYSVWNDSDFAGGQGNYEGTAVLANYVLAKNVKVTGKYFSDDRGAAKESYKRIMVDVNFVF